MGLNMLKWKITQDIIINHNHIKELRLQSFQYSKYKIDQVQSLEYRSPRAQVWPSCFARSRSFVRGSAMF